MADKASARAGPTPLTDWRDKESVMAFSGTIY